MMRACVRVAAALFACFITTHAISDEEYYLMPKLFHLDDYNGCLATRNLYCMGSFELTSEDDQHQLYQMMKDYSSNWVDHFNHTRLHRGLCVSRRCPPNETHTGSDEAQSSYEAWFSTCVNESTTTQYNLSARLYRLDYCKTRVEDDAPLSLSQKVFAGFVATLLILATVCTVLDMTLPDYARKNAHWTMVWSVPACWNSFTAPPPTSANTDLRAFDGLRVVCMLSVIIEHVVWLSTLSYVGGTRYTELTRRAGDVMLMTNSTLVVQIFFLMSSFLLAHKLLQQRRRQQKVPPVSTFVNTMVNRIIRLSPSYFVMVWFAASWWERLGRGPMWTPLVETEANICQRKWWTHLLFLNNILYADDKCLIQTWYLAADMQLYAICLLLTLALWKCRKGAIYILTALLIGSIALVFGLAYTWRLVPTFVMHRPELIRNTYSGESSFNVLYQSPLGNLPGALAGLLMAHLHHALLDAGVRLNKYKWFCLLSSSSTPLAMWWAALSPLLLGSGAPTRGGAAALAALERPVFALFVTLALLGAMHGVQSPWGRWMSWSGFSTPARLSFGALLIHMPLNKTLVASRIAPTQLDRQTAIIEWFGIAVASYLLAMPLALLVELPAQRLYKCLTTRTHVASAVPSADTEQNNNSTTKSRM